MAKINLLREVFTKILSELEQELLEGQICLVSSLFMITAFTLTSLLPPTMTFLTLLALLV